jgi:pyrimidine operon attenuation protein/uracil phosphoribosyltransferase
MKRGERMKQIMDHEKIIRTIRRISHEIIEKNVDLSNVVLMGILQKGMPLANMIKANIKQYEEVDLPLYELDITGYRDDYVGTKSIQTLKVDVSNKVIILCDDVLYTGRTARAAMDAVIDLGRPSKIQFAALIDRGHRELPIRADYVGKNLPTSEHEKVHVHFTEPFKVTITDKN